MVMPDSFLELYYGKYRTVDLHGLSKEDAKIQLIYELDATDADISSLIVVHGYIHGTVIKKLVRDEFTHPRIDKKVNLDAARTIFLLKK